MKSACASMRRVTVVVREGDETVAAIAPRYLLYLAAEEDPLTAPQHEHRYVFNHHLATYYGEPFEAGVAAEFGDLTAAL